MHRILLVAALAAMSGAAAIAAHAGARPPLKPKSCGVVSGPTAHVSGATLNHYGVIEVNTTCGFAKDSVRSIVRKRLRNTVTPVRAKGPAGWICVAQEVDSHVAVAGHCSQGRSKAFSWVGAGLHI